MKVAIAISGQARPLITYWGEDFRGNLVKNLIEPNNADVYCAFWRGEHADSLLNEYKPKAYILPDQDDFVPGVEARGRDNVLRMFYMMDKAANLVPDGYDYIVRVRPELYFKKGPIIIKDIPEGTVANNYWMSDKHPIKMCDHFFYTVPALFRAICDWSKFSERLANYKGDWLHPETTLDHIITNVLGLKYHGEREYITGVVRATK